MALRLYVCNTYKQLRIGKYIQFKEGSYETEEKDLQELIEANNLFGISIHFKDTIEEMEKLGKERDEQGAAKRAAERKRIMTEMDEDERIERERKADKKAVDQAEAEEDERLEKIKRAAAKAKRAVR